MVAQAEFSTTDVVVQPGDTATLSIRLSNIGNHTETYTLIPSGLLAGWVRIEPPAVTLFGGTSEDVEVTVRPPRLSSTPAGPAPLTVRIIPLDEPDDVIIAETTATIGSFHERHIRLLQPVARSRRRADYEFLVENAGNSLASCRLHLIDTSHRLDGDFDPPAAGIEPGGNSLVRLRMKAVRRRWNRGPRTIPFSIEADEQGFPTATAHATFVQSPVMPERLGRRFAALVLLAGALAGAWFGLIRPEARRAAEKAVRDQPDGQVVVTTVPPPTTTPVTAPPSTRPGDTVPQETSPPVVTAAPVAVDTETGTLFSHRFTVDAPPKESLQADPYVVAAGQELRITDFFVQNANGDSGFATVRKDDQVIARWDLAEVIPNNESMQFFSPYVVGPGSTLTFTLECDAPGVPGQCSEGLLVSGRLVTL